MLIFCVDLVTMEALRRHKCVDMHVVYRAMRIFSVTHGSPPPTSELCLQITGS